MCIKNYIYVYMCWCAAAGSAEEPSEHFVRLMYNIDVTDKGNKSIETLEYDTDDHLTFSCDFQNTHQDATSVTLVHQLRGLNVSESVTEAVHNVTYSIFGDVFDHESEVYCIKKIWNIYNALLIESRRVRLISRSVENNISKEIHTIYYNEGNSAYNICQGSDTCMRKIVDDIVYSVPTAEEISLTPSDTGAIFYCETKNLIYKLPNNEVIYTREILNKTKYVYCNTYAMIYTQTGIGVGVVAIVCIVLVAGILLYRSKHKPPDVCPAQHIYAELILPESQPTRNLSQNLEEAPYVQIIGFIGRKNNNTTASVA